MEALWRLQLRQDGIVACELASRKIGFQDHMPHMTVMDRWGSGQAVEPRWAGVPRGSGIGRCHWVHSTAQRSAEPKQEQLPGLLGWRQSGASSQGLSAATGGCSLWQR
jgi:hypothetical protein